MRLKKEHCVTRLKTAVRETKRGRGGYKMAWPVAGEGRGGGATIACFRFNSFTFQIIFF